MGFVMVKTHEGKSVIIPLDNIAGVGEVEDTPNNCTIYFKNPPENARFKLYCFDVDCSVPEFMALIQEAVYGPIVDFGPEQQPTGLEHRGG